MIVCRTDNVKIFQETMHLPQCSVVQKKSDLNPLVEASGVSYVTGMTCLVQDGFYPCAWICMVPSTKTNWELILFKGIGIQLTSTSYIQNRTLQPLISSWQKKRTEKIQLHPQQREFISFSELIGRCNEMLLSYLHRSSPHHL